MNTAAQTLPDYDSAPKHIWVLRKYDAIFSHFKGQNVTATLASMPPDFAYDVLPPVDQSDIEYLQGVINSGRLLRPEKAANDVMLLNEVLCLQIEGKQIVSDRYAKQMKVTTDTIELMKQGKYAEAYDYMRESGFHDLF